MLRIILMVAVFVLAGCNTPPRQGDIVIPPPPPVRY